MTPAADYTPVYSAPPRCFICGGPLALRLARGRKSGKPFVMLLCSKDPRHLRGFVNDAGFVSQFVARLEGRATAQDGTNDRQGGSRRSKTNLELGGGP